MAAQPVAVPLRNFVRPKSNASPIRSTRKVLFSAHQQKCALYHGLRSGNEHKNTDFPEHCPSQSLSSRSLYLCVISYAPNLTRTLYDQLGRFCFLHFNGNAPSAMDFALDANTKKPTSPNIAHLNRCQAGRCTPA